MALIVVDMAKAPPNWHMNFIQRYGIPTGLIDAKGLQKADSLRDFSRVPLLEQHIVEVCQKAITDGRPIIGKIDRVIQDAKIVASGIVVPDPTAKKTWCIILSEVHSISAVVRDARFDDIDLSIVQLLREGLSAREIGHVIELSPRTVEHRIERMKARAGVKSIVPLLIAKN
ncbi:AsnC family protein [Agrobacterium tumefaciens]|uniref:helix-turn-helix transcriptional regulator n=1 Tax=Agrobacterium tumefaciens TaxID=358 RepID=UPI0015737AF0|nr:AsnC family protein [Agrobacterium tumefaciens]NSZ04576.1 AsnC family protein [Agrobacterium tumefaciens]NSZ39912.1 AsnC family protein [Agrobacterium tumefaciens]NTB24830.1 AsnC family protein [Agrobacterium tumefaciens]NTB27660.1 AsnC family protein [Agrobacterium tumefaciens]NTB34245.1 AsnC family protein [Agrobacterium tumefaciens]